jgi:hypothetical protein
MNRILIFLAVMAIPLAAFAQQAPLQGGPWAAGHAPMYSNPSAGQTIIQDSGPARGGSTGLGLSELLLAARGTGAPPYASQGTGPYGTNQCDYDGPIDAAAGYHFLCFSANANGGGVIAYGAGGVASPLPFSLIVNGVSATGYTGTKTAGSCALTIINGLITNVTGC